MTDEPEVAEDDETPVGFSWWEAANRRPYAWFFRRVRKEQSRMISADDDARFRGQGMATPRLTKAQRARKERDA